MGTMLDSRTTFAGGGCMDAATHASDAISSKSRPMRVLVTGSSGLVGGALMSRLAGDGVQAEGLLRAVDGISGSPWWDPAAGTIDGSGLEGFDGVVHLAGEGIAEGRWSPAKMRRIRESRVTGTRLLCEALARCRKKPPVLVCASAIGFYGDRGSELLDEGAQAGAGFLPEVCQAWEEACEPARAAGIRVVNLRIGVVLSRDGGALAKMLAPFRFGLGGKIGSGQQWMSWIELGDLIRAIEHALCSEDLAGPVNAVSPMPVTNLEFTKTLGSVISRPTVFPLPAPVARLVVGKMADDLLLASIRVQPNMLASSGFEFEFPQLEDALRKVLHGEVKA